MGYVDDHKGDNEGDGKSIMNIWNIQEVSMSHVDMKHHMQNIATKHYTWVYNHQNLTDTAIAISSARCNQMNNIVEQCTKDAIVSRPRRTATGGPSSIATCRPNGRFRRRTGAVHNALVAGDMNVGVWAAEHSQTDCALKEMLAAMNIVGGRAGPPISTPWTWKGPNGKKKCYDYSFSNRQNDNEGAPYHIMERGDHRAVSTKLTSADSYAIKFKGCQRDPTHSWRRTPTSVARLARKREEFRPASLREVQEKLADVAKLEIEQMQGRRQGSDLGSVAALPAVSRGTRYRHVCRLGAQRRLPPLVKRPCGCDAPYGALAESLGCQEENRGGKDASEARGGEG